MSTSVRISYLYISFARYRVCYDLFLHFIPINRIGDPYVLDKQAALMRFISHISPHTVQSVDIYKEFYLQGYNAIKSPKFQPTFWRKRRLHFQIWRISIVRNYCERVSNNSFMWLLRTSCSFHAWLVLRLQKFLLRIALKHLLTFNWTLSNHCY
jgi:hypothetical protein